MERSAAYTTTEPISTSYGSPYGIQYGIGSLVRWCFGCLRSAWRVTRLVIDRSPTLSTIFSTFTFLALFPTWFFLAFAIGSVLSVSLLLSPIYFVSLFISGFVAFNLLGVVLAARTAFGAFGTAWNMVRSFLGIAPGLETWRMQPWTRTVPVGPSTTLSGTTPAGATPVGVSSSLTGTGIGGTLGATTTGTGSETIISTSAPVMATPTGTM